MGISTVLIVKNEATDLEKCLSCVAPFSDEIVIVDTGSTDGSKDIAKKFNASIFDFDWCDDFSKARNFAISKAQENIIFSIDADERVDLKDHSKFFELKKDTPPDKIWGFSLPIRHYINERVIDFDYFACLGEYSDMETTKGYIQTFKTLLFPNCPQIFFEDSIHETVEQSILKNNGKLVKVDIPVHHYGYLKEINENKSKSENYAKLLLKEIGKDDSNFKKNFDYGHYLLSKKRFKEALIYIKKAYDLSGNSHGRIAYFLGVIYFSLKQFDEAKKIFEELCDIKQPSVYYHLIQIALIKNDRESALKLSREALRLFKDDITFLEFTYKIYIDLGKDNLAKKYLQKLENILKCKKRNL